MLAASVIVLTSLSATSFLGSGVFPAVVRTKSFYKIACFAENNADKLVKKVNTSDLF